MSFGCHDGLVNVSCLSANLLLQTLLSLAVNSLSQRLEIQLALKSALRVPSCPTESPNFTPVSHNSPTLTTTRSSVSRHKTSKTTKTAQPLSLTSLDSLQADSYIDVNIFFYQKVKRKLHKANLSLHSSRHFFV